MLTFTSLYPNAAQPAHGLFVERRLVRLVTAGGLDAKVLAPVPWFPSTHHRFGKYARFAAVPDSEIRHAIDITHTRFPVIPKVSTNWLPWSMARFNQSPVARMRRNGFDFQLIDAHYFYPDGVAAARLAKRCGVPFVVTARGSDVNVFTRRAAPRRMIVAAARQAAAVITVSASLKQALVDLGVDGGRIHVLRNGVDLDYFRPGDTRALRRQMNWRAPTLLSVGHLIASKGHHHVIAALPALPGVNLVIVGEGDDGAQLQAQARRLGVSARVHLAGPVSPRTLSEYYAAADALVLASEREGMPNVVLESLACGTPVIATAVGGIPEVVNAPEAGCLIQQPDPEQLAAAVKALLQNPPSTSAVRAYAEQFGWEPIIDAQLQLYRQVAA